MEILLEKESTLYCAAGEIFFRCKELYCDYMEILLEKEKAINCAPAGEIFFDALWRFRKFMVISVVNFVEILRVVAFVVNFLKF